MSKRTVSATDFGAEPSAGLQTEKIQDAVDSCFRDGGGEVRIPEGVFLTGGIRLRSNVTLRLMKNAVLRGSRNPEDYFGYLADKVEPLPPEMITDGPCGRVSLNHKLFALGVFQFAPACGAGGYYNTRTGLHRLVVLVVLVVMWSSLVGVVKAR